MTLQQLRYVTAVAGTGTISHAVQQFYISQPSLTNAIREHRKWGWRFPRRKALW